MARWGLSKRLVTVTVLLLCGTVAAVTAVQLVHAASHCAQVVNVARTNEGDAAIGLVVDRMWLQGWIMALVVLLVSVFTAVTSVWYVCAPIDELAEAAEAVANGELARCPEQKGPADLARVAHSVNALAGRIKPGPESWEGGTREGGRDTWTQVEELEAQLELRRKNEHDLRQAKEAAEKTAEELRATVAGLTSQLKEAEREATRAEVASHIKSEFLADMSHGIRTHLTSILGFAETLLDATLTEAERQDAVSTVKRNGEHLLGVVDDILDISRIEAGTLEVHHEECSVFHVVAEVQALIRVRANEKKLTFDVDYIGELPATIQTDPYRLRQILINLLNNAVEYTDAGGIHLVVQFSDAGLEPMLVFEVIDTGMGMTPEVLQRLFTPYSNDRGRRVRAQQGSGLSLAISKQLVQMLGGDLAVESARDQGTTFRFTIATGPLDGVEMVDGQEYAILLGEKNRRRSANAAGSTKVEARVLLAEDGVDNLRLISALLTKSGVEVTAASDGQEAIERVRQATAQGRPFDVVLMDMEMPRMDGYAATGLLRGEGYDRPIIALTAHAMAGDREKCVSAGCDDYLSKPVDRMRLFEALTEWAGRRSKHVPVATSV